MKTEKEIKRRIKKLREEGMRYIGKTHHSIRYKVNLQVKALEWVLED